MSTNNVSKSPLYLGSKDLAFPAIHTALKDPNGLLAYGGELSEARLIEAYSQGIFPWFNDDDTHILWWSPNPRAVLYPPKMHVSRSLRKLIKQDKYHFSFDSAFSQVMYLCAATRPDTWITQAMQNAYLGLHNNGIAHSIEVWNENNELVGGLYGVSLGRMFFGESMFSLEPNTSKLAIYKLMGHLLALEFICLDCQMITAHLASLGAIEISRNKFAQLLEQSNEYASIIGVWSTQTLQKPEQASEKHP
ncbi:MAG: leucyl/phenylalanyl-tRNA--protein transferase [Pseudomonadales bacterium]|nr:leucyl/phenylalanyl-tRNA--protein transferase [Pseudomonadales bacterium]